MLDRRIARQVDDNADGTFDRTERYVYDGEDIALVFDGAGSLKSRYLHGPGIDEVFADEDALGEILWALTDNQGTVRDWARTDGTIANHVTYDAFGKITGQTSSTHEPLYAYTGREWDADAEMYHYRARWYDPAVGRFVSEDPIGFEGGDANLSRYVGNSPPNYVDFTGLWSDPWPGSLPSDPWPGMSAAEVDRWQQGQGYSGRMDWNQPLWLRDGYRGLEQGARPRGYLGYFSSPYYIAVQSLDGTIYTVDTRTNRILRTDDSEVPNRTYVDRNRMAEAIGDAPDENSSEQYRALYEIRRLQYLGNTCAARVLIFDVCVDMLPAPGARDVRGQGARGPLPARKKVHGNTAGNQPATLYEKYDASGNFLKHGVSQNPRKRYTQKELDGGYLIETQTGPRKEILKIERDLVERSPGPQNKEPWAGKRLGE